MYEVNLFYETLRPYEKVKIIRRAANCEGVEG